MAKFIDKILLFLLFVIIINILLFIFNIPTYLIIIIIALISTLFFLFAIKSNNKYNMQLSFRDFIIECIKNEDYLISFISEELCPDATFKKYDDYFILDNKYYFLNLKFSALNYENLIIIYKKCKNLNIKETTILTAIKDRRVLNLIKYLDIKVQIIDLHIIYKKLKKMHLLKEKRPQINYNLFEYFQIAFKKQNIKGYLLSSIIMFSLSYIAFYKTYYLVFGFILFGLFILSLITNIYLDNKTKL